MMFFLIQCVFMRDYSRIMDYNPNKDINAANII